VNVELCTKQPLWDAYVEASPLASNYHRWVWRGVIEKTYAHRAYYLTALDDGAVAGLLPLVMIRSHMFGDFLVSMPFFSYGGVLATSAEARDSLLRRAVELAGELGARHIELRQGPASDLGWQDVTAKVTMVVPLPPRAEELWNRLSSKMRQRVRFARKQGLAVRWEGREALAIFYQLFATNMRDLGTPVYPQSWFENIMRDLGDEVRIVSVWDQEKPVAAGLVTPFRETVELPWSGSLLESRRKQSVVLMFWSVLEWAMEHHYRWVDFGRCTRGSGVYEFKQLWLSEERPLHWYYWLAPGVAVPDLRPSNPRYRLATSLWKHLPLPVANRLGPHIVRSLP
jgi:serine/alanine adding enzyme